MGDATCYPSEAFLVCLEAVLEKIYVEICGVSWILAPPRRRMAALFK